MRYASALPLPLTMPTTNSAPRKAPPKPGASWPALARAGFLGRSNPSQVPGQVVQRQAQHGHMDDFVEDFTDAQLQTGDGFRGCDEEHRANLISDIAFARLLVRTSLEEVEKKVVGAPAGSYADKTLEKYLKADTAKELRQVERVLQGTLKALNEGPKNWRCLKSKRKCRKVCGKDAVACAEAGESGAAHPVELCPAYHSSEKVERIETLIHEAAHQAGVTTKREKYVDDSGFFEMSGRRLRKMADAYAGFVMAQNRVAGPQFPAPSIQVEVSFEVQDDYWISFVDSVEAGHRHSSLLEQLQTNVPTIGKSAPGNWLVLPSSLVIQLIFDPVSQQVSSGHGSWSFEWHSHSGDVQVIDQGSIAGPSQDWISTDLAHWTFEENETGVLVIQGTWNQLGQDEISFEDRIPIAGFGGRELLPQNE